MGRVTAVASAFVKGCHVVKRSIIFQNLGNAFQLSAGESLFSTRKRATERLADFWLSLFGATGARIIAFLF